MADFTGGPGFLAFVATFLMVGGGILLFRSLGKHLRKVRVQAAADARDDARRIGARAETVGVAVAREVPLLRPLRLLRLVTLVRVVNRRAASSLRGQVVAYTAGGSALLAFVAALAVLDAERGAADAGLVSFGDAVWWAVVTMTTVGYGDYHPVTAMGRVVAAGLMVGGIALLGAVTATLASWMLDRVAEVGEEERDDRADEIAALREQVARLADAVEGRREPPPGPST